MPDSDLGGTPGWRERLVGEAADHVQRGSRLAAAGGSDAVVLYENTRALGLLRAVEILDGATT